MIEHDGTIIDRSCRVMIPEGRVIAGINGDGVRVLVDGSTAIENWSRHGPTSDRGVPEFTRPREVEIVVEHFETDGFATLSLEIEPARQPQPRAPTTLAV